jgi:butyrate kinase
MVVGNGGLVAHLGTNSAYEAEQHALNGDAHARFILEALSYQVAKAIGSMVPVLKVRSMLSSLPRNCSQQVDHQHDH